MSREQWGLSGWVNWHKTEAEARAALTLRRQEGYSPHLVCGDPDGEWREVDAEPQTPVPAEPDRLLLEHGGETVDEFVCHGVTVHGEVMSDECYWIGITKPGGRALMVNIVGSGLVCHIEDEGEGEGAWPWGEVREHDPDVPQADVPAAPVPAGDPAERIAQAIEADYAAFADSVDPDEYHAGITYGLSRAISTARSIVGAR